MKNHRVVVSRHGGPEVLQVVEEDLPEPGDGEVRLKVLTAGVSGYDLMHRRSGRLPGTPKVPFTLGLDVVGHVDEIGRGSQAVELGAGLLPGPLEGGGYTEFVCIPADELVPVPDGVDSAEAVCVVSDYLTADLMLHQAAEVRSGESILVQGAAGGVGTALLELGSLSDLEMYGTASEHNHELVSALGATPIDYQTEDFVKRIRELDRRRCGCGVRPDRRRTAALAFLPSPPTRAGGWCGSAWPRPPSTGCGSFRPAC